MASIIDQFPLRLFILGSSSVGKTSLIHRLDGKGIRSTHIPTIGKEITYKKFYSNNQLSLIKKNNDDFGDGDTIELDVQIIDVSENKAIEVISKSKGYSKLTGFVFVFDRNMYESFLQVSHLIQKLYEIYPKAKIPILIVGQKIDRDHEMIKSDDLRHFVNNLKDDKTIRIKNIDYIFTSAKTGENVNLAFETIIQSILDQLPRKSKRQLVKKMIV